MASPTNEEKNQTGNHEVKLDESVPKKMATPEEINELIDFIGGFEYWNLLNDDCRIEVIKHLNFASRYNLSKCSKADWETDNKIAINIQKLTLCDSQNMQFFERVLPFFPEEGSSKAISVKFENDPNSVCELIFAENENDTELFWCKGHCGEEPEFNSITLKSCNFFEETVKFFERLLKRSNFEIEDLFVCSSEYPVDTTIIKSIKCKTVRFGFKDMDLFRWWIQRMPNKLESLVFVSGKTVQHWHEDQTPYPIPQDILAMPQILNTPSIHIWSDPSITDETFMNLKARKMFINGANVTDEAVNNYLMKWARGNGAERFKRAELSGPRDLDVVLFGLNYRPWDEVFMAELGEQFLTDFTSRILHGLEEIVPEEYVQVYSHITPCASLTVRYHEEQIHFLTTGFQKTNDKGELYSHYAIP